MKAGIAAICLLALMVAPSQGANNTTTVVTSLDVKKFASPLEALKSTPGLGVLYNITSADQTLKSALINTSFIGTVFAPNDQAIQNAEKWAAANCAGYNASLFKNQSLVQNLVLHHVFATVANSTQISEEIDKHNGTLTANALDGTAWNATKSADGSIYLNNGSLAGGAKVVKADILAANGVVHVIDKVIIPEKYVNCFNESGLAAAPVNSTQGTAPSTQPPPESSPTPSPEPTPVPTPSPSPQHSSSGKVLFSAWAVLAALGMACAM